MNYHRGNRNTLYQFNIDVNKLDKIIKGDAEELNKYANEIGKVLKEQQLSTSQIRNFLNRIQKMKKYDKGGKEELHLIRPLLAYAAGRHGKGVKTFQRIIEKTIPLISNNDEFEYFRNFVEAIVAYHKFYGGK